LLNIHNWAGLLICLLENMILNGVELIFYLILLSCNTMLSATERQCIPNSFFPRICKTSIDWFKMVTNLFFNISSSA
jgi:hypothetical protein